MKAAKFVRFGRNMTDIQNDEPANSQHKTINQAKKASFKLQMKLDGALGRGSVQLK